MSLKFSADVAVAKAEMAGETKKIVQFKSKVLQKLKDATSDKQAARANLEIAGFD